jgi:hypothetical protein
MIIIVLVMVSPLAGCSERVDPGPAPVILITLDTTRADWQAQNSDTSRWVRDFA